ncbi:MAG TPA: lysylphosphatidylglycerol synthase transmembrane domain-containing protein [Candidatus Saccharimonadales bacterium]|jgi:uncharacterized protein (TIRG00374 family)|nr:lysylphosphatidylglycerol synthase transmembrane domain-containing protein [Candidatus Saccharimonadales bacterium]
MRYLTRTKLRTALTLLGIIGLAIVLLLNRHQLASCWHLLKNLRWYIVAIIVIVQVASYWVNALYYRSILRIFSYDVGLVRLFKGALATNFVNYILPSVGLAGAGYLSQVLSPEVPRGKAFLTQLMRYAFSALAVLLMMPVGFILIYLSNNSGQAIVRVTLLSVIAIIALVACVVAFIHQESAVRRTIAWLTKTLKRAFPAFKINSTQYFINEFYVGYRAMSRQKRRLLMPFAWSIIYIVIELGTFYMAFLAFGKVENPGIAVMAYLFANIASIFGGIIFSTGIFELGMAGTLVALGTPLALAVSVTTVYRVLNLLIGLPPGYYFYRRYLP